MHSGSVMLHFLRRYRVVTVLFIVFSCKLAVDITQWFMALPAPNNAQGGFASATVLALIGIGKYWMETKAHDGGDT